MEIIPAGTFGAQREDYARINEVRPKNIIVFLSVFSGNKKAELFIRALAEAFPDRKIILSPKISVTRLQSTQNVVGPCVAQYANVSVVEGNINLFERLRMAQYAVSDASTTVIEAIQFGLFSFFMDVSDTQRACYYRRYPDLCMKLPEQLVIQIRKIESGQWVYPRDSFSGLVDVSGRVFFDVVREKMGLKSKSVSVTGARSQEKYLASNQRITVKSEP
jgi:hypothetical protein